jgi:cyclic pyranopterin phosphate synthase
VQGQALRSQGVRKLPVLHDEPPRRASLPLLHQVAEPTLAPGATIERAGPRSVRISVTDRCDYACTYCRPSHREDYASERMPLEAWETIVDALLAAGVQRFRLTGGEPLVFPKIVELVEMLAKKGVQDLALTTNASQLAKLAGPLRAAGLMRINVSLDTLLHDRFATVTRGGRLADVLAGIDAAAAAGLGPIKLNTVVLRGVNDDELEPIVQYAWSRGLIPRFLEIMPIAEGARLVGEQLVTVAEMRARLAHLLDPSTFEPMPGLGPARYASSRSGGHLVGFISGTSDTFCASCDRLRVSSTGALRPCLATDVGVDAQGAARAGDADEVRARLAAAWSQNPDGTTFKGCTEPSAARVSMRAIGG